MGKHFTDGSYTDLAGIPRPISFTVDTTGFDANPSGTARYQLVGGVVLLSIPTLSGTSNSTAFTLTGLPAEIRPSGTRNLGAVTVTSGGAALLGTLTVNTDGTMTVSAGVLGIGFGALLTKGITAVEVSWLK